MLAEDRDAVICDLAETYHIIDMTQIPVMTLATLCAGLRNDSRIKMQFSGLTLIENVFTQTRMADTLSMILYLLAGGKEKPELYQDIMAGKRQKRDDDTEGFATPEEFEEARRRIING